MSRDMPPAGGDPLEAFFSTLGQNPGASPAAAASQKRHQPVEVAWTLEVPHGAPVELNMVTLYKKQRFVSHVDQETQGWRACTAVNRLKQEICSNPVGCARMILDHYIGALLLIREHVSTNEAPYAYNGGNIASPNIDFELYMNLATLAARDTREALAARRLQTSEGYVTAYDRYMRAAQILDETRNALCSVLPPRDRVHYGNETSDWLQLVGPGGPNGKSSASVAQIIQLMGARANILRCEAHVSAYRAIEAIVQEDPTIGTDDIDGAAAFVSQQFTAVMLATKKNRRIDAPCTRLELYASFMANLFRMYSIPRLAASDLDLAEHEFNATYLARALRRLDRTVNPGPTQDEWLIVDEETRAAMRTELAKLDELRARAEKLRSEDTTGVFSVLDMTGINTMPLPIDPVNPNFAVGQDDAVLSDSEPVFSFASLRKAAVAQFGDLLSFLELRTDQRRALAAIQASPSLLSVAQVAPTGNGRTAADGMLNMFATRLARHEPSAQWLAHVQQRIGTPAALLDIMAACFAMGKLGERQTWLHFQFSTEDPVPADAPPSETTQQLQEIDRVLLNAAKYLVDLEKALALR